MQAETLLSNIFGDLILMEAFKILLVLLIPAAITCIEMVHVSSTFDCKDHFVSSALKREPRLSFPKSVLVVSKHPLMCEEE